MARARANLHFYLVAKSGDRLISGMLLSYLDSALFDQFQIRRPKCLGDGGAQRIQFLANKVVFDPAAMNLRGNPDNYFLQVVEFGVGRSAALGGGK